MHTLASLTAIDATIIITFLLIVLAVGAWWARKERTAQDFYLASRRMPMLAAAASVVATSLSVVTFLGAPQAGYTGNFTYLITNVGTTIGIIIVALWFIPAFYKQNVITVYEILGTRFSPTAQLAASIMFMLGRTLASGVRLYLAAIPTSLVLFNDLSNTHLILSICAVATIATLYTMLGGIGAVIWTDTLQLLIVVASALACIVLLARDIEMPLSDIISIIQQSKSSDGSSKLTLIDTRLDPQITFTLWSSIVGFALISVAVYGTDQDLTQRLLTCKSTNQSRAASIVSQLITIVVIAIFLILGLLLFVWYSMQPASRQPDGSREIFLQYILDEIPPGLKGLMLAGIFAAAMSSLDSALNAMSAVLTRDILKRTESNTHSVRTARRSVIAIAILLTATACSFVFLQQQSKEGLLPFALGVMTYAHSGLLAVFACALFTKRGNTNSVIAAFITGIIVALVLQFLVRDAQGTPWLSIGWRMTAASLLAFTICILGSPKRAHNSRHNNENSKISDA